MKKVTTKIMASVRPNHNKMRLPLPRALRPPKNSRSSQSLHHQQTWWMESERSNYPKRCNGPQPPLLRGPLSHQTDQLFALLG